MSQEMRSFLPKKGIEPDIGPECFSVIFIERIGNSPPTGEVTVTEKPVEPCQDTDGKNHTSHIMNMAHMPHDVGMLRRTHEWIVNKIAGERQDNDAEKIQPVNDPNRPFPDIEKTSGSAFNGLFSLINSCSRDLSHNAPLKNFCFGYRVATFVIEVNRAGHAGV